MDAEGMDSDGDSKTFYCTNCEFEITVTFNVEYYYTQAEEQFAEDYFILRGFKAEEIPDSTGAALDTYMRSRIYPKSWASCEALVRAWEFVDKNFDKPLIPDEE
jgi:hypothetical protein